MFHCMYILLFVHPLFVCLDCFQLLPVVNAAVNMMYNMCLSAVLVFQASLTFVLITGGLFTFSVVLLGKLTDFVTSLYLAGRRAQFLRCCVPPLPGKVIKPFFWLQDESESCSLCLNLCNPMDCRVHGILQARILQWVAFPFSMGSSQPRDQTQFSRIAGGFFTTEPPVKTTR